MGHYKGRVAEFLLEPYQNATARLAIPPQAVPRPGQYLQAWSPNDELEAVPRSLFAAGPVERKSATEVSLPVLAALPASWQPGTPLNLRGPLGRGFELPRRARRVALAALGSSPGRLLPLVPAAIKQGAEVVVCCETPVRELPLAVELRGLDGLAEALRWADFVVLDVPLESLERLNGKLSRIPRTVSGQVLVLTPMPCGGLAKCGVCSLATESGARLACEDGPVFELGQLVI